MSISVFKSKKYWKGVFWAGLFFVVFLSFLEYILPFIRLDFSTFVELNFGEGKWLRFLISRLVGGLLYGIIITYGFQRSRKHKNQ